MWGRKSLSNININYESDFGGLGERFNPPVLKTGVRQRTVSSNLTPSAINRNKTLFYIIIKLIIFFGVQRGVQLKRGYPVYPSLRI